MTEPTKEQIDTWREKFKKLSFYKVNGISMPLNTAVNESGQFESVSTDFIWMGYLAAKKSDFEEISNERKLSYKYYGESEQLKIEKKQLEQELRKKSNMLAKVKSYFGISVRKNSEMRQELQKTREQLNEVAELMKIQRDCINHLLGKQESFGDNSTVGFGKRVDDFLNRYFQYKQGESR